MNPRRCWSERKIIGRNARSRIKRVVVQQNRAKNGGSIRLFGTVSSVDSTGRRAALYSPFLRLFVPLSPRRGKRRIVNSGYRTLPCSIRCRIGVEVPLASIVWPVYRVEILQNCFQFSALECSRCGLRSALECVGCARGVKTRLESQ